MALRWNQRRIDLAMFTRPQGTRARTFGVLLSLVVLMTVQAGCGQDKQQKEVSEAPPGSGIPPSNGTPSSFTDSAGPWTQIYYEDFSGTVLDPAKWAVYNTPDKKPPRIPEAVGLGDGELRITGGIRDGKDLSGGLGSTMNRLYGKWEVRFRVDRGAGYAAIVLLWPQTNRWPDDGAINMVDVGRGDRQSALYYLHNGPSDVKIGGQTMRADFTSWHTVGAEWLSDRVTFYLDGVEQRTIPAVREPGRQNPVPSTSLMHLAIQLDVGCDSATQCRDAGTPPAVVLHVDWVKIYKPST